MKNVRPVGSGLSLALVLSFALTGAALAAARPSQVQALSETARNGGADAASAHSLAQVASATLTEQAKLLAPAGANGAGCSVSLSGNRALIGSLGGAAYTFVSDGHSWVLEATLVAADGNAFFGGAVSLSGNRALIGASAANSAPGAAYIFVFDGSNWSQEAKLISSGSATNDYFGAAVALQGSRALVGANGQNSNKGAAYIFSHRGSTWSQTAQLFPQAGTPLGVGYSVALSGKRALVGAIRGSFGLNGSAYVFTSNGRTWSQTAELSANDGEPEDFFAASVALSGDSALIGAPFDNSGAGSAYLYAYDGTSWKLQSHLFASDGFPNDDFGASVSISGTRALVGAYAKSSFTGSAYVYAYDGTTWTEQEKLIGSDSTTQDLFGYSVSLDGSHALSGAFGADDGLGATYIFAGL
jgi:hypothetical protein